MQEYKQAEFFNNYFSKLSSFKLTEEFKEVEEKPLYRGVIEAKDTIHPLQISVEIPKTFPHHKLIFLTSSLSGYPHLIYNEQRKKSWFCLNTPFAETAEEQLNQELLRLEEWIARQMRPDLKAIITEPEVIDALRKANAYEWENSDEMNEYSRESMLTFVGDFAEDIANFKERIGSFHCVRNGSRQFFAFEKNSFAKEKLPYIIVDEIPEHLSDFISMKEQFNWGQEICDHLLPDFDIMKPQETSTSRSFKAPALQEEEAMILLNEAIKELIIPDMHREIVEEHISLVKANIKKNKGIEKCDWSKLLSTTADDFVEMAISQYEEEYYQYALHYFALGIIRDDRIFWLLMDTNRSCAKYESVKYDLKVHTFNINRLSSFSLSGEYAQYVKENDYFGRGKLTQNLSNKKIAIIGLGAIGSMIAESLVRGGVKQISLWDNDVIEPGNICRTAYTLNDVGESKERALSSKLQSISPFCEVSTHGGWLQGKYIEGLSKYQDGEFYGSINYNSQSEAVKPLSDYDLIIDCTASNELLHFLSYAVTDKEIISLCITNHAQDLLCITNKEGNPYELRKLYLSKIEQDTKNFYVEGTGCYSPTFLATNCDIAALVNLAAREINLSMEQNKLPHSTIWSYGRRGVIADKLELYTLEDNPSIRLSISSETRMDGEDMTETTNGMIGYLLGAYCDEGKHILVSHIIEAENAEQTLNSAFNTSNGIVDYIGDYTYSCGETDSFKEELIDVLASKAADEHINTNNPLLAIKNLDGSLSFFLYLNNALRRFVKVED